MRNLFAPGNIEKFPEPLLGTVETTISPNQPGRVKCRGTSWPARFHQLDCQAKILPDEPVVVVAIQGIMMLVEPLNSVA